MAVLPKKQQQKQPETLTVIDDESDFYYNDDEWEGCCGDPIELYEDELLKEDAGDEDKD